VVDRIQPIRGLVFAVCRAGRTNVTRYFNHPAWCTAYIMYGIPCVRSERNATFLNPASKDGRARLYMYRNLVDIATSSESIELRAWMARSKFGKPAPRPAACVPSIGPGCIHKPLPPRTTSRSPSRALDVAPRTETRTGRGSIEQPNSRAVPHVCVRVSASADLAAHHVTVFRC